MVSQNLDPLIISGGMQYTTLLNANSCDYQIFHFAKQKFSFFKKVKKIWYNPNSPIDFRENQ